MRHWLPLLVSIDARRPASWLALAVAVLIARLIPDVACSDCPSPAVMAVVVGALLAVMAIGDAAATRRGASIDVPWIAERAAWPLVGWLLAAGSQDAIGLAVSGGIGITMATALVATLGRCRLLAADTASTALVAAASAGAAGWCADCVWPDRMWGGGIAIGMMVGLTVMAGAVVRQWRFGAATSMRSAARHLLTAAAMMGAMAGMVGWLFLATDLAAFDLVASIGWFVALAVPAATLGDGVSQATVWRRLERAAPQPARAGLRLVPGRFRDGVHAALTTAALLGWPPLVAATLAGTDAARSGAALLVVGVLATAAIMLLVVVGLGRAVKATPDTQLAVAVAGACLCVAAVLVFRTGPPPGFLARPFVGQ